MAQIRSKNDIQYIIDGENLKLNRHLPSFFDETDEIKPIIGILYSIAFHILFIVVLLVVTFVCGLVLPRLPKPELPNKNIEFRLVQSESKPPINKKTKIRSDVDSQAGGKHDPKKIISEPRPATPQVKKSVAQKPKQNKQVQKAQPKQESKKVVEKPTQTTPQKVVKPMPAKPTPTKAVAKPTLKPVSTPKNVVAPSAPKIATAPKSPFVVPTKTSSSPVGTTYKANGAQNGTIGATGKTASAPAPKFSSSGASSSLGSKASSSGSSGGQYASRGSYGSYGNPSPGNPNGAPGIDALRQPNWGPYMRNLEQRIKRNWTPPKGDSSKRVVIIFTIGRDGRLLSSKVEKTSGVPLVDRAAMSAVELSAPFPPLPPEFRGQSVPIEFTFDYNVINSIMR